MGYKQYCKEPEKIENYERAKKDNFKGWHCHHRLETHTSDGERRLVDISVEELQALRMYYKRPASELIFLPRGEHSALHDEGENHPMYGKHHSLSSIQKMSEAKKGKPRSAETRNKLSTANKGEKNPMYGKHLSEEHKKQISAANKGNKNTLGTRWYNNGKENKLCYECPEGFVPGRLKGNKNTLGTRWYNNGKINIRVKECPEGFVPGRLR